MAVCANHVKDRISVLIANICYGSNSVLYHKRLDIFEVAVSSRQQEVVLVVVSEWWRHDGGAAQDSHGKIKI